MIGHSDSLGLGDGHREQLRWIGKPWRRIELVTNRHFWRGEQVDVGRDLTFHFGLRRFGIGVTLSVTKQSVLDYGDEVQ